MADRSKKTLCGSRGQTLVMQRGLVQDILHKLLPLRLSMKENYLSPHSLLSCLC